MRAITLTLLYLLLTNQLSSQNLIPNGSFELVKKVIDENITGSRPAFNGKVHAWYSPTDVSPDIYLPHPNNANFPDHFKIPNVKDGKHYIGLVLDYPYSVCKTYKEYVQVKLKDTLAIGTTYLLEFWASSKMTEEYNVSVYFSKDPLVNDKCSMLLKTPQLNFKDTLAKREWKKISFEITPSQAYNYITVGNFVKGSNQKHKYCYFDDFRLFEKGTTITDTPSDSIVAQNNQSTNDIAISPTPPVSIETIFNANNIQFEYGKYNLTTNSLSELDHLITYLKKYSTSKIMIEGHTDDSGNALSNQKLSTNRIKAVITYMQENGIRPDRVRYKSHGATQPIASNNTEEGRRLNRRVTFLIEEK